MANMKNQPKDKRANQQRPNGQQTQQANKIEGGFSQLSRQWDKYQ
jgi:hypothetical protein